MAQYELYNELTPTLILSRTCQKTLFKEILGIEPDLNHRYRNPLRKDENPTCTFDCIDGKWVFRDWSEPKWMDIFDIVQRKYNVNYYESLRIVAIKTGMMTGVLPDPVTIVSEPQKKPKATIKVAVQCLQQYHFNYLHQYGITPDIARRFNVYSPGKVWLNDNLVYTANHHDPALGYYFGINRRNHQKWKLYFYFRLDNRFISNTNRLNGWVQLPSTGDLLIMTKSMKDVMVYHRLGLPAVAMQGEAQQPHQETMEQLQQRFSTIVSNYDFDRPGIYTSQYLKRNYGIQPMMFTNGRWGTRNYKAKDISDFVRMFGLKAADQVVHKALTNLI